MLRKRIVILVLAVCAAAPGLWARGDGKKRDDENELRRELIHRPQDVAPPEQVIVARPYTDYRVEGGLLRQAAHQPRRVDLDELARRKRGLYAGKTYTNRLPALGEADGVIAQQAPIVIRDGRERGSLAVIAYWTVMMACGVAAAWLLMKSVLTRLPARSKSTSDPSRDSDKYSHRI